MNWNWIERYRKYSVGDSFRSSKQNRVSAFCVCNFLILMSCSLFSATLTTQPVPPDQFTSFQFRFARDTNELIKFMYVRSFWTPYGPNRSTKHSQASIAFDERIIGVKRAKKNGNVFVFFEGFVWQRAIRLHFVYRCFVRFQLQMTQTEPPRLRTNFQLLISFLSFLPLKAKQLATRFSL